LSYVAFNPPPIVLGHRVFGWGVAEYTLMSAARAPSYVNIVLKDNETEQVIEHKDPFLVPWAQNLVPGHLYVMSGLMNMATRRFSFDLIAEPEAGKVTFLTGGILGHMLRSKDHLNAYLTKDVDTFNRGMLQLNRDEMMRAVFKFYRYGSYWSMIYGGVLQSEEHITRTKAPQIAVAMFNEHWRIDARKYLNEPW